MNFRAIIYSLLIIIGGMIHDLKIYIQIPIMIIALAIAYAIGEYEIYDGGIE